MKNKKIIFIIITLIIVVAVVIVLNMNVFKTNEKNSIIDENTQNLENQNTLVSESNEVTELNNSQLEKIANFLNEKENNGFLLSNYNDVSEVNLYYIISQPNHSTTEEEMEQYERLANQKVTTGLCKMTTEEVESILTKKFGTQFITTMNTTDCYYIEQNDSYYTLCGDDLYTEVICTNGTKNENIYTVNFKSKGEAGNKIEGTVTLAGQDDEISFFISNKVAEE